MTNYLVRRMNRELSKTKFRMFGTSALILMAVAAYISMAAMAPSALKALEEKVDTQNLCDYMVHFSEGNTSSSAAVSALPGISTADYRLTVSSRIRYSGNDGSENVSAMLIGIEPSRLPPVNTVAVVQGSYFSGDGAGTALIERGFGSREGIDIGETVSVLTGTGYSEFEVSGHVSTPEFMLLPFNPQSILPIPGTLAVLYLPIDSLRTMFALEGTAVNEVLVLLEPSATRGSVISSINELLAPNNIVFSLERDQIYGYALVKEDLAQAQSFAAIMAFMVLFAAFFVIYSHFSRTVEEQKRHIGVLRALGYSRRAILGSYIYMALVMGVTGSVAGLIAGYPIGSAFSDFYASEVIGGSSEQLVLSLDMVLTAFMFGPMTACLACAVAVWGTVSMEPHDAMREARAQKRPHKERKLRERAGRPHVSFMTLYTLRNIFRRARRTTFTIVAIAFAIVLGGMAFPLMGSFMNSMDSSINDYEHWDIIVEYSYPLDTSATEGMTSPNVLETVQIAKATCTWVHDGENGMAVALSLEHGQDLHEYNILEGTVFSDADEGMIGYALSKDLGIKVGDSMFLEAAGSLVGLRITAVVGDLAGDLFVHQGIMESLMGSLVFSGAYVRCVPGGLEAAEADLLAHPLVANVQSKDELQSGLIDLMESYNSLLYAFSLVGVGIATVTIANVVFMGILERYKEYGQLRAIGYSKTSTSKSIITEILLTVAIAAVVSLPLLYALLESFVGTFKEFWPVYETMVRPADMVGYLFVVVLTMVFGVLAALPAMRYLNKMDLARTVAGSRFG